MVLPANDGEMTMTKRRMVAAIALVVGLGVTPVIQGFGTTNAQWGWALDMDRNEALAFGAASLLMCSAIPNPGAIACGAAGLL